MWECSAISELFETQSFSIKGQAQQHHFCSAQPIKFNLKMTWQSHGVFLWKIPAEDQVGSFIEFVVIYI